MSEYLLKIEHILDLKKWQSLQDSLADVTKLAILTVDYKGLPIASHSRCCSFCELVREDPELLKRCQKCDARGGLEAVRSNAPFLYLCHYNIVDIAIPICVDDRYIGAVMAGQVKLKTSEQPHDLECIHHSKTSQDILKKSKKLQLAYKQIPELELSEIEKSATMLFQLCNYIVEEAKNKQLLMELYQKPAFSIPFVSNESSFTPFEVENFKELKHSLSRAISNAYINTDSTYTKIKHKQLEPAFQFIHKYKNKTLSLYEASKLCYLSPSYFSRLFFKETGESYTTYTSHLKIKWAKDFLEKTELSITQISDELSFSNPSYFIRTFSKFEGITPAAYRSSYRNQIR